MFRATRVTDRGGRGGSVSLRPRTVDHTDSHDTTHRRQVPSPCRQHVDASGVVMSRSGSILGNAVLRLEDPALLTGSGRYVDDLVEPGTLHVAFVRSTVAHANLVSVDVAEALSMPGVVAVYHAEGEDLGLAPLHQFEPFPP